MNDRIKLLACLAALAAAACSPGVAGPVEPSGATCSLDGMALAEFPGPKGQIVYDQGPPDFFCDTVELVAQALQPEQRRRVLALYTQDMARTSWEAPQGHWIDARSAFYVIGSAKTGSMGATLATFSREDEAREFARTNGGRVLRFSEITPAMVALDGGVLKDTRKE